jgi:Protein of unknown function, DUF481
MALPAGVVVGTLELALVALAAAQEPVLKADVVPVYLDCQFECDTDFLHTEISYVNWVRDPADAEVHVIVSSQVSGNGGRSYAVRFIGLKRFNNLTDELTYGGLPTDGPDQTRRGIARQLKLGLVRYLARTPLGSQLELTVPSVEAVAAPQRDPWNHWVFTLSANLFAQGETQTTFSNLFGSLSANRVTDRWRVELGLNGSRDKNRFTLSDSTDFISKTEFYEAYSLAALSLSKHWTAGVSGSVSRSTRSNYDLSLTVAPGVEYNVFDYGESTKRQLTFLYEVRFNGFDYHDLTIFGKTKEQRLAHALGVGVVARQPWGSVNASLTGSAYLSDWSQNQLSLTGGASVRLVKGLNLRLFGSYSRVRDQLNLAAGAATPEEILRQLRELKTGYRYFLSAGLSYSFGSIYNNIVNPRFGSRSRQGDRFFF